MSTLYHHIYGFSMCNTLTKALHEIVSIIQVISSFFVFNKPLEIPSYIPLFSQCRMLRIGDCHNEAHKKSWNGGDSDVL